MVSTRTRRPFLAAASSGGRRGLLADTAGAHADDQALFFNQGGQTHESPPLRVSVSMRLRSAFAIC